MEDVRDAILAKCIGKFKHIKGTEDSQIDLVVIACKDAMEEYATLKSNPMSVDIIDLKWLVDRGATHEELIERIDDCNHE